MIKQQRGFTLIELMIVVAIVAILAAVAWPSYQNQVRSTNRADAQGALLGLAQAMERHFTQNGTYEAAAVSDADTGAPQIFPTESPLDGANKTYDLRITAADGSSYVLQAQPKGSQAADGIVQLSSSGEKVWDRDNDGDLTEASDLCWNKTCN
ncbi:general secretion pathway protein GspH [Microbulbifer flavimaris]|uniref:General secretion pathway protein GspH n=1 Tax=Microbulbifer flavimaris TaxID=1781068 RepID=A0ABX4HVN0_9GAMM|nr:MULTISPECIES: type IV pilin protein [Microbulbifer]KUJ79644.1 general secretion pathway protein GspH [Microbulbifer sp. ZGT114]PCO04170.1 general secretion pathway protein GspH [Microbulbifer flavimaris]